MKKIFTAFLITFVFVNSVFCFDWPESEVNKTSFQSYYGQERGGLISSSIIFNDCTEVQTVEKGRTLVIFEDEDYFFPSTLGAAVIISHDDNLSSVYGNLDSASVNEKKDYEEKEVIGNSGNTAWQQKENTLELQILDFKDSVAINPFVLMPRTSEEPIISISGLRLRNKNGTLYDITESKYLASGTYKIYSKRNDILVPYQTSILINGIQEDSISFDSILQENEKIYLSGKRKYDSKEVYPNENLILLGETTFTPGKSTIVISVSNNMDAVKTSTYNITIY